MKSRRCFSLALLVVMVLGLTSCSLLQPGEQPSDGATVEAATATATPTVTLTPTATTTVAGPVRTPPTSMLVPTGKRSLKLSQDVADVSDHVDGFIFPNGYIPLLAAALTRATLVDGNQYKVGVVELRPSVGSPELFLVAVDLQDEAAQVSGRLIRLVTGASLPVAFNRTTMIKNPQHVSEQPAPPILSAISSDSVCFYVDRTQAIAGTGIARYCAVAPPESPLAVRSQHEAMYGELVDQLSETISVTMAAGWLDSDTVDLDRTISEAESERQIDLCAVPVASPSGCHAEFTGAPIGSFWQDYARAKSQVGGNSFFASAAVMKVHQTMSLPNNVTIAPGDYVVDYWYQANETFIGATISGTTTTGAPVIGKQIPAVAATYTNLTGVTEIVSYISAWDVYVVCLLNQSNCP